MNAVLHYFKLAKAMTAKVLAPTLLVAGYALVVPGIVIAVTIATKMGLFAVVCGVAAIATSRIIELLQAIESDLAAIRSRLDMGVFGLLGTGNSAISRERSA